MLAFHCFVSTEHNKLWKCQKWKYHDKHVKKGIASFKGKTYKHISMILDGMDQRKTQIPYAYNKAKEVVQMWWPTGQALSVPSPTGLRLERMSSSRFGNMTVISQLKSCVVHCFAFSKEAFHYPQSGICRWTIVGVKTRINMS